MINLTPAFRQKLFNDERNYLEYADITLADGTELHLTNANIWQNGFTIEDSVGDDNTFSALGSAIINSFTLVINNIYETYSEYDFTNARVVVAVGMELPNPNDPTTTYIEKAWKGEFGVDEATYNGSIITLKCLDDMVQFDRPYSHSTLVYPATLGEIVRDACAVCLGSANDLGTQQFPHYTYSIPNRPDDEKLTFREVISWCAAIAGCFARMAFYPTASASKLEIKWFNQDVFEQRRQGTDGGVFDTNSTSRYTTGDTLDGGTFNPWNTGDVADAGSFTDERPFHHITSLYQHNISVDDVVITGVRTTVKDDDEDSTTETITELTGTEGYVIDIANNEFITKTNATEIRTWIGQQLVGLKFRKASVVHPSDPSIEAGDIAFVYDRKGNEYPLLVTRTIFQAFGTQTTVCGASTPNRNSATRYNEVTKSYIANRKMMKQQKKAYDEAIEDLAEAIENAKGMYTTVEPQTGGGNIIYVHNNPILAQSDVVIKVSSVGVTVTSNYQATTPTWYGLTVTGNLVANLISALGINFEWAVGTTLTLGGANNGNGVIRVLDADGNQIGIWNKDGLTASGNLEIDYTYSSVLHQALFGLVAYLAWNNTDSDLIQYSNVGYKIGNDLRYYAFITGKNEELVESVLVNRRASTASIFHSWEKNILFSDDGGTNGQIVSFTASHNMFKIRFKERGTTPYSEASNGGVSIGGNAQVGIQGRFSMTNADLRIIPSGASSTSDTSITFIEMGSNRLKLNMATDLHLNMDADFVEIKIASDRILEYSFGYWRVTSPNRSGTIAVASTSSKRYKHDISYDIDDELDARKLYNLRLAQFVFNDDHKEIQYADMRGKTIIGFIAEDVDEVYPNAVIHNEDGQVESWDERRLLPPMLALIQEQKKQLDEQQQKIESLEDRIEKLEKLVEKLL